MFISPSTGYEWRFRLFGVPVEVQPFFWLVGLILLGEHAFRLASPLANSFATMLASLVMFFLSFLIHELGHVLAFRYYGIHSRILLHGFGGLAIPTAQSTFRNRTTRWRDVIIAGAGPFLEAVFVAALIGISFVAMAGVDVSSDFPFIFLRPLNAVFLKIDWFIVMALTIYLNLFWIVFNLLPILPMDGGRISEGLCKDFYGPHQGRVIALGISIVAGILVAIWAVRTSNTLLAIFVGYMAFQSLQELQGGSGRW